MIKNKVVLVPFPFDDFTRSKVRPALCLSNIIGKYDHVVIAFISSQIPDEVLDTDILVKKNSEVQIQSYWSILLSAFINW